MSNTNSSSNRLVVPGAREAMDKFKQDGSGQRPACTHTSLKKMVKKSKRYINGELAHKAGKFRKKKAGIFPPIL